MIFFQRIVFLFSTLLSFFCIFCSFAPPIVAAEKDPLQVVVSILPQEYFVERIGGDRVKIATLVQPGHSPATYSPTPRQMASIATAQLYFRIGVPFENALIPKLNRSTPEMNIIDLRQGLKLLPMEESHDDHHEHEGDLDPHTWLDPKLALKQSALIRDTLIRYDPEGEALYDANFASLAKDLNLLDQQLKTVLQPLAGKTAYVFHPAYGYFCRAYGLKQKAINPDGKDPGARYLARLIEQAKSNNVRVFFVQPQFSDKAARTLARSIEGSVIALDPLARNYLANMQSMANQLVESLSKQNH